MRSRSRRQLLTATAAVLGTVAAAPVLAACGLFESGPDGPPPPDPLTAFHAETLALVGVYERALVSQADRAAVLTPIRDAHRAHTEAVAKIMIPPPVTPSGSAVPAASAGAGQEGQQLVQVEQAALDSAIAACLAGSPERATLLGEIAAARAGHVEALS